MPYCHSCTSNISPQELHDFSSKRKGAKPIYPVCFSLGKLDTDGKGGMKVRAK